MNKVSTLKAGQYTDKLLILLILITIALRLVLSNINLYFDRDEVRKLLRTSGFTADQFIQLTYDKQPIPVQTLLEQYQTPCIECSESERNLSALKNNKEHPPLYYLLLHNWLLSIGNLFSPKLFSSLISIATIPAIYWVAKELFGDSKTSLISAALFSVSPYQFSVSQHVSQYSLWIFFICISTAIFLNSIRTNRWLAWVAYTITNILGCYTHLFFLISVFSHSIYLLITRQWKLFKIHAISVLSTLICFAPWILGIISSYGKFEETTGIVDSENLIGALPLISTVAGGAAFFVQTFVRKSNISLLNNDFLGNPLVVVISVLLLILFTYFISLKRDAHKSYLLILINIYLTITLLALLGSFLEHGLTYKVRYYSPAIVFVLIGVSYLIGVELQHHLKIRRFLGMALFGAILLSSFASTSNLFAKVSLNQSSGRQLGPGYVAAASTINSADHPLVISREEYIKVLMLSHRLRQNAEFLLVSDLVTLKAMVSSQINSYQRSHEEIFIFNPSDSLEKDLMDADLSFEKTPTTWSEPVIYQLKSP